MKWICMSAKAVQIKNTLIIQPSNITKNTLLFTVMASGTKRRVREGYTQTPTQHQGTTEPSHNSSGVEEQWSCRYSALLRDSDYCEY